MSSFFYLVCNIFWVHPGCSIYKYFIIPLLFSHATVHLILTTPCVIRTIVWLCLALLKPYGLQPGRLLRPWDFPDKDTGVGCHFIPFYGQIIPIVWIYTTLCFIHSPIDGYLGGFCFLAIINNVSMNTYVQIFMQMYLFISLGCILDHMLTLCLIF